MIAVVDGVFLPIFDLDISFEKDTMDTYTVTSTTSNGLVTTNRTIIASFFTNRDPMLKKVVKDIKIYCDDKFWHITHPQIDCDTFFDDNKRKIEIASSEYNLSAKHLNSSSV